MRCHNIFKKIILCFSLIIITGCSTVYYNFWEALGKEKRDLLKSNMISAEKYHSDVKDELKDSLEVIRKEYQFKAGKLEKTYDTLSSDYQNVYESSEKLRKKIKRAEDVANDLFTEWKKEAIAMNNKHYRRDSLTKLRKTKKKFKETLSSMKSVEKSMNIVLIKYKDHVTYLKHNLNAKMIGNLKVELKSISHDMRKLITKVNISKSKAKEFISKLN